MPISSYSLDPLVNLIPYRHTRLESFPSSSGSFAANHYLLPLIHVALNFDFFQNIALL